MEVIIPAGDLDEEHLRQVIEAWFLPWSPLRKSLDYKIEVCRASADLYNRNDDRKLCEGDECFSGEYWYIHTTMTFDRHFTPEEEILIGMSTKNSLHSTFGKKMIFREVVIPVLDDDVRFAGIRLEASEDKNTATLGMIYDVRLTVDGEEVDLTISEKDTDDNLVCLKATIDSDNGSSFKPKKVKIECRFRQPKNMTEFPISLSENTEGLKLAVNFKGFEAKSNPRYYPFFTPQAGDEVLNNLSSSTNSGISINALHLRFERGNGCLISWGD